MSISTNLIERRQTRRAILRYWWLVPLLALQLPAVWYALRTPLSLVDDHVACQAPNLFSSFEETRKWLHLSFLRFHTPQKGEVYYFRLHRYMIGYDLYNALTWGLFGSRLALHHLARLVLKLFVAIVSWRILRQTLANGAPVRIAAAVFLTLFLFYPNNPEARLSPCELLLVFFYCIHLYYLCELFSCDSGPRLSLSRRYLALLASYIFMLWSKETCVVFALSSLLVIIFHIRSLRQAMLCVPFAVAFSHFAAKIYMLSRGSGYGKPLISVDAMTSNLDYYCRSLFLWDTSKSVSVLVLTAICAYVAASTTLLKPPTGTRQGQLGISVRVDPAMLLFLFVLTNLAGFLALCATFWLKVLRYWYPAMFLVSLLASVACGRLVQGDLMSQALLRRAPRFRLWMSRASTYVIAGACVYFIGSNYFNFLAQYATQYYTGKMEKKILAAVGSLLEQGKKVYVYGRPEETANVVLHFCTYLPKYRKSNFPTKDLFFVPGTAKVDPRGYILTLNDPSKPREDVLYARFGLDYQPKGAMKMAYGLSAILQGRDRPFTWTDAGARDLLNPAYDWKISRRAQLRSPPSTSNTDRRARWGVP